MSLFVDYTADEQRLLLEGPRLAAVAISAASLGRGTETAAEGFATAEYIMAVRPDYLGNTLITSIQYEIDRLAKADWRFASYSKLAEAPDAKAQSLARLAELADLLDLTSDPDEAAGYKQWVLGAATVASEAGKEGGNFFGRGAVAVDDAERAALAEIKAALRL
jgi:hypothetical protein